MKPTAAPTLARRAVVAIISGCLLLLGTLAAPSKAQTPESPGLIGVNLSGDSDALSLYGGQQASQGYPQAVDQTAHTETRLFTGPNSSALASIVWPGKFLGNLGSLIQVFGGPPESANLNYPVRAEASSSGTQKAQDTGAVAEAEPTVARAEARLEGFDDGADFLSIGDARSTTTSALEGDLGVVTSTATVTDMNLGGGAITIDSVVTRASVSTDGVTGTATGDTLVSGLVVAGQPATVDENGVRFAGSDGPDPSDAIHQALIDETLANFSDGFAVEMYLSDSTVRDEGSLQEYRSGALVVLITFGDPQGDGGDGAFIVGGSNAYAQATQGFPLPAPATPDPVPPVSGGVAAPPEIPAAPSPAAAVAVTPGVTTTVAAPPPAPETITATSPIGVFTGIPFVMPFFVLLASVLLGRGLQLLHASLTGAPAAFACTDRGSDR